VKGVDSSYAAHVRHLYGGPPDRDGYDLARLFAAGESIQHVTRQPGWSVLMDLLSAEREGIRAKLEGSKPLDHAEASHLLGQLRGIAAAEQAAHAISERYRVELEEQQRKHESTGESVAA
jgi:hypothetical protein